MKDLLPNAHFLTIVVILKLHLSFATKFEPDPNGYIVFCPCMGKSLKYNLLQ